MKTIHKGWFWICPIYLMDLETEEPKVWARLAILEPLFTICQWFESARIMVSSMLIEDYEPEFMFRITGVKAS